MSSQMLTDLMQSTAESDIKFYFITKSGTIEEASEDLKYSFEVTIDFLLNTLAVTVHIRIRLLSSLRHQPKTCSG